MRGFCGLKKDFYKAFFKDIISSVISKCYQRANTHYLIQRYFFNKTTEAQLFHTSNPRKRLPYQILDAKP